MLPFVLVFKKHNKEANEASFFYIEGVYSANLVCDASKPIYKTFFPAYWNRKEVANAIHEACHNFVKSGAKPMWGSDGKCKINSITNSGMKIEMRVTQTGKIVTAYPQI